VTLGGRRILVPRLRARSVDGAELVLPSFAYAAGRDPLDAHTLNALAVGVATRAYQRTLDPLPTGRTEHAVAKSSVSRRFVALTRARLTTWLAQPLDALDVRVILIDGLHCRGHVILLALGIARDGQKHVLARREGTTENATVCKALLTDENLNGLVGHFVRNVRRWRDGAMLVRWIATGLQEAQRRFRRIRGCGEMPALIRALDRHQVDTKQEVA